MTPAEQARRDLEDGLPDGWALETDWTRARILLPDSSVWREGDNTQQFYLNSLNSLRQVSEGARIHCSVWRIAVHPSHPIEALRLYLSEEDKEVPC